MKALTILQPWAEMIARGLKRIENRTWPTHYRGPLAIHAGKGMGWMKREDPLLWPERFGVEMPKAAELTFGAIIAVAELVDCVPIDELPPELEDHAWASGPWCWILEDVRRTEPIACAGFLSLWTPPDQIMPSLLASVEFGAPIN